MTKYLLAILAVLLLIGAVCWHVSHEHHVIPAPPPPAGWTDPAPTFPAEPPVVPVEPEPATPAAPVHPVKHKPVHHKHVARVFRFHGQSCYEGWIILPGSVTCRSSGEQFLPDELEWSIPRR